MDEKRTVRVVGPTGIEVSVADIIERVAVDRHRIGQPCHGWDLDDEGCYCREVVTELVEGAGAGE